MFSAIKNSCIENYLIYSAGYVMIFYGATLWHADCVMSSENESLTQLVSIQK